MFTALALTAVLLAAAPNETAPPAQSAPAEKTDAKKADDKDPMVCQTKASTGSRVPTRTCVRKSVRDEAQRQAREDADRWKSGARGPFDLNKQ